MAKRYYTEEAYEQIKNTIDTIQLTDVGGVKDFFSDLWSRIKHFLGFLKMSDYGADMQGWYNQILDSHNTTLAKVDAIFSAVESVDFQYRDNVRDVCDGISVYSRAVNTLADVISGKISLADGQAAVNRYISSGNSLTQTAANTILIKLESRSLSDASKELLSDAIKLGGSFCKLLAAMEIKDAVGTVSAAKKFGDAFIAASNDLAAMVSIITIPIIGLIGAKTGMDYDRYLDYRFQTLAEAEGYRNTNSISDALDVIAENMGELLDECPEDSPIYSVVKTAAAISDGIAEVGDAVDIAADAYDIIDGISDIVGDAKDLISGQETDFSKYVEQYKAGKVGDIIDTKWSDGKMIVITKVPPRVVISRIISDQTNLPISGWTDPAKVIGNIYKTAGTIWSYVDKVIPNPGGTSNTGGLLDTIFKNNGEIGLVKDIKDLLEDIAIPVH